MIYRVLSAALCVAALSASASGCAAPAGIPVSTGSLFTSVRGPIAVTGYVPTNPDALKTGTADCMNILGMIAIGDASIDAARRNGNITKVYTVDVEGFSVLGLFAKSTTVVRGEGSGPATAESCPSCGAKLGSSDFCTSCETKVR